MWEMEEKQKNEKLVLEIPPCPGRCYAKHIKLIDYIYFKVCKCIYSISELLLIDG
jgi:hypothetical protein